MDAGVIAPGDPREIVDLLWCQFLGLAHLAEIRANLRSPVPGYDQLRRSAFDWMMRGVLSRAAESPDASGSREAAT